MRIRVLLVEDRAIMRDGQRSLLADMEDIEVVGRAADGGAAPRSKRFETSPPMWS